eukprot:PhM_4_TR9373/c0_g1_i1/m.69092
MSTTITATTSSSVDNNNNNIGVSADRSPKKPPSSVGLPTTAETHLLLPVVGGGGEVLSLRRWVWSHVVAGLSPLYPCSLSKKEYKALAIAITRRVYTSPWMSGHRADPEAVSEAVALKVHEYTVQYVADYLRRKQQTTANVN